MGAFKEKTSSAIVAVTDLERAQRFHSDTLGLELTQQGMEGVLVYKTGATHLVVYPSEFAGTDKAGASELQVSEGQAGQAIVISGAFAVVTSLLISSLAGSIDRKVLLLALTGVMAVSGAVAAAAPNYMIFMIGRALIGVVIGGFWSMSAATAMRLVPEHHVPRALAIFNGGNALATVVAPPLLLLIATLLAFLTARSELA